ncbi:hypothetical protein NFI96_000910 [Prochilodus magdalenae]|nr:hypothetical protein NFI96_000910 [Prochilodus magdalenae]
MVGMTSSVLEPGLVLLSGGFGRGGRHTAATALIRKQTGWTCATVELDGDKGVRLYHALTSVPGWGAVVTGGRTSPLNPMDSVLKVTYRLNDQPEPKTVQLTVEKLVCAGQAPKPRWRHTATLLSHGACAYRGGLVIFGGLGQGGVPLGDVILLKATSTGFVWERLELLPALVPRYSHTAHVIGENLVVVGGVWLQADGVPGVAVINLTTGGSIEVTIDTSSVPWPLMLHSFCSELLDSEGAELVLIGGGGNCFSFGTHLNAHPVTLDLRPVLDH